MEVCASTCTITFGSSMVVIPIYCDDCGREKLAEIRGNKLIIYDTRHGQKHFVTIEINKLKVLTMT